MKWIGRLIKLAFLTLFLGLIFHNFTARVLMASYLRWNLGVPVSVGQARVDFLSTQIFYRDVIIKNPYGFPEGAMAKIPYLILDLEPGALLEKKISLYSVEADVSEIQIVRLPDGRMNWTQMKVMKPETQKDERLGNFPKIEIHRFYLTLRRALFRDLSQAPPRIQNFNLILDKAEYLKVHNLEDMAKITAWEALKRMGMAPLSQGILDRIRFDLEGES